MDYDLIVRGGTVVEGTRLPRFRGDVGIKNGKVAKIGRIPISASAGRVLDATGCIVAPGFVDLHTHYDAQIHWDPYCTNSGWHGTTSVVFANCGFGFAPVKPAERDRAALMMTRVEQIPYESIKEGMKWTWESFPEWFDALQSLPKGVNIASFMPVTPLMIYIMGLEAAKSRPATPAERKQMQILLNEAMDAGACGFSIQRLGAHSPQADYDGTPMPTDLMADEDVIALAEVLRDRGEGAIQLQQREAGDFFHSSDEAMARDRLFMERLAEVSQRPVLHNTVGVIVENPRYHVDEMKWIHECNEKKTLRIIAQGITIRSGFNFTLETWNLYDSSPAWNAATQGSVAEKMRKMADPATREQMRAEHSMLKAIGKQSMPEVCTIMNTPGAPELEKYIGRTVGDIAQEEGKHPADAMLDIAVAGKLKVEFECGSVVSDDAEKVGAMLNGGYILPGASDGGAHGKVLSAGAFTTDLLTWLVRDTGKISLEDAHYLLSYLPAQVAGMSDRGFLREDAPADVVIYDLAKLERTPGLLKLEMVHDLPAGEWRFVQRAKGYRWTIVNGKITFEDGRCSGATPGQLLRIGQSAHVNAKSAAA